METTTNKTELIEGLYMAGYRAHSGTSFDPEKRATNIVSTYETELTEDLKSIPTDGQKQYAENYKKYLFAWLGAKSRCLSTMITGPANFNVRRNEKANRSENNRYNEFREWRQRAFKAIEKRIESAKTPEERSAEAWRSIQACILDKVNCIIEIDKGINTYTSRQLIASNLSSFIKRIAKNGQADHTKKALELLRQVNAANEKPIITDKSSIWKLEEVAETKREQQVDRANKEAKEFLFNGGKLVLNYEADRLQIFHDQKPEYEKIQELKKCAFRWSPFNKCWQRQLTHNAIYTVKMFLKLDGLQM